MNLKEAIKIISNLVDYAQENWIDEEYEQNVKDAKQALKIVKSSLKTSNVVGEITIGRTNYKVCK